jgi:MoxR-like ATPase
MHPLVTQASRKPGQAIYQQLFDNICRVIKGQDGAIRKLLAAFFSGGHVLIEDHPGTGKTTLAKALALSVDIQFKRIQFTPDLLPTDILGVSIFNPQAQIFQFHEGPIFANLVLADEINRASPRTQAALLEAMAESQVSVEGKQRLLPDPFFVIATQNPSDAQGTYPLPEAQMDRFALQFNLGFAAASAELEILAQQCEHHSAPQIQACIGLDEIFTVRNLVKQVRISEDLKRYMVEIVAATRQAEAVQLGASLRGSIALMKVAQALALFDGYGFVTPDHIQEIAIDVLAHRLVMSSDAGLSEHSARDCIEEILATTRVPI